MPDAVIELTTIQKRFGQKHVLNGMNLRVEKGKTYAFLGRNGAGKTTAIRMLMGLLKPDAGKIRVTGLDPANSIDVLEIRRRVGYLAEDQQMWGWMKIREIIRFISPFYPTWDRQLAQQLLDQLELPTETKIRHLSKGQNVRLGLLLALAHRPEVVILDDPALGLDPIMRKEFLRDVVEHLQGRNITVFFSSHLLYEVEPVADVIGILHNGKLVCQQDTETLREQVRQFILPRTAADAIARLPNILDIRPDGDHLALTTSDADQTREQLAGAILAENPLNLDEIFAAYVAGKQSIPPTAAPQLATVGGAK